MTSEQLQYLIHRQRSGTASPDELQQLNDYWQQSLTDASALDVLSADEKQQLEQRMFRQTVDRIQQREPGAFRPVRPLYARRWLLAAAAIAGVVLLGTGWFLTRPATNTTLTVQTRFGEKKKISLPDGSTVWLNGHSSLRYVSAKTGDRQVWLTGEGLFSVRHTPTHRKFVVHTTSQLNVEVLGTVFNVTDRRGSVSVVLRSGSVRVTDSRHRQADVLLKPGEMVSQVQQAPALIKAPVQAAPRLAWTAGSMTVENKPLGELFDWIEDTYGLTIDSPASLRAETFAGTVPTDSINTFFTILPKLYPVHVRQDGRVYHLDLITPHPLN